MNTPSNYSIIDGVSASQLAVKVNKAIQDGWIPIGSICVTTNRFYQAMVQQSLKIEIANSLN